MDIKDVELMHDLRLPLQLIASSAELLGQALEDPAMDARGYLDMLNASVRQMKGLLDGVMAAARTDAPGPVDIVACLRALVLRCRPRAEARGVALDFAANVDALALLTDEGKLSRVALNLLSNALKAAPAGGHVSVRLAALGDYAEIAVIDDGPGMDAARLSRAFLPGETDGGCGYGLPSARDCARALGGTLTAVSEPGRGSAFTLRLPVRLADAPRILSL